MILLTVAGNLLVAVGELLMAARFPPMVAVYDLTGVRALLVDSLFSVLVLMSFLRIALHGQASGKGSDGGRGVTGSVWMTGRSGL